MASPASNPSNTSSTGTSSCTSSCTSTSSTSTSSIATATTTDSSSSSSTSQQALSRLQARVTELQALANATKASLLASRDHKWAECKRKNRQAQKLYERVEAQRLAAATLYVDFDLDGADRLSEAFLANARREQWRLQVEERETKAALTARVAATAAAAVAVAAAAAAAVARGGRGGQVQQPLSQGLASIDAVATALTNGGSAQQQLPQQAAATLPLQHQQRRRRRRVALLQQVHTFYADVKAAAAAAQAEAAATCTDPPADCSDAAAAAAWDDLQHKAAAAVVSTERMLLHNAMSNQMVGRQRARASQYCRRMEAQLARERALILAHLASIEAAAKLPVCPAIAEEAAVPFSEATPGAYEEAPSPLGKCYDVQARDLLNAEYSALLAELCEPVERFGIRLDEPCWTPVLGHGCCNGGAGPCDMDCRTCAATGRRGGSCAARAGP